MSTTWPSVSSALYIAGQISRLNNAIDSQKPTDMSRYSGGHNRETQPYITGHHQVLFYLPETLFAINGSDSSQWLQTTCENFTPHSYVINTGDVLGIGQVGVSYPLSKTTNREFTLSFREYTNMPISSIIKAWHALFDPLIGTSPFGSFSLAPFSYKGIVIVAILKPTATNNGEITEDDLEEVYMYQGVYPITSPTESSTSDQSTNDSFQIPVTFKFDGAPLDLGTLGLSEIVVAAFNGYNYNSAYEYIGKSIT